MLPLPQEYVGSMTEIQNEANNLLAMGRIIKIDKEALELSANGDESIPLMSYRTPVKLFVHNSRLPTRILMGLIYLSTDNFTRIEEVRALQDYERRGAFRVSINVRGRVSLVLTPAQQALYEATMAVASPERARALQARYEFDARVLDVSLTGLRFQTNRELEIGSHCSMEFTMLNQSMNICLQVQRRLNSDKGGYQYGCIYFDYSERQMNILCQELFQLQRFEKNRRRNAAT